MPELLKCSNCGKPVSSSASKCPHCGINRTIPERAECRYCRKLSNKTELSFVEKYFYDTLGIDYYYHASCLNSIRDDGKVFFKRETGTCSVCNSTYVVQPSDYQYVDSYAYDYCIVCSYCGHSNIKYRDDTKFSKCPICSYNVFKKKGVLIESFGEKYYVHNVCNSPKNLEEFRTKEKDKKEAYDRKIEEENYKKIQKVVENELKNEVERLETISNYLNKISWFLIVLTIITSTPALFYLAILGFLLSYMIKN